MSCRDRLKTSLVNFVVCACLVLPSHKIHAEAMTLEVIPLQHSLLSEVLPILKPMVIEGGSVTGMNDQLIVRTTPSNLLEIKQILRSIDTPPRRLMITVKQNVDGNLVQNEHGISGRYRSGDVTVGTGPDDERDGAVIAIRDKDGNVLRYRTLTTKSDIDDRNTFKVQTIAGQAAFIQQGSSVPVADQQTIIRPDGVVVFQDGVQYRDVTSGFYVLPRLNGDRVTLFVSPQLNRVDRHESGVFDLQNIETTAHGYLGEWIQIGGVSQQHKDKNTRYYSSTRSQGQQTRNVLIRVDEIK